MADNNRTRSGSLQFYPRVRAKKMIPRVNWNPLKKEKGLIGFLGYKVGMISVFVKDNTPDSLTKGKRIVISATILECPKLRIYSVRFYKNKKIVKEVIVSNEKELKRKVKFPKALGKMPSEELEFDDARVVAYSLVKTTAIGKKKPDMVELGLGGSKEEKLNWINENLTKEISIKDTFEKGVVDARAITKGYGSQGPVKRFGIALKVSKSEKGQRRPGSLAPWHPARVTFRAPQMGQTGFHTRVVYNNPIIKIGNTTEENINKKQGFHKYGVIDNDFIILAGSIQGPKKRAILLTSALRPTKKQTKKLYEVIELR